MDKSEEKSETLNYKKSIFIGILQGLAVFLEFLVLDLPFLQEL